MSPIFREPFSIGQPAVSKHWRIVCEAGLVSSRSFGREEIYTIEVDQLRGVYDWSSHFEKYWDNKLGVLGEFLDRQKAKSSKRR